MCSTCFLIGEILISSLCVSTSEFTSYFIDFDNGWAKLSSSSDNEQETFAAWKIGVQVSVRTGFETTSTEGTDEICEFEEVWSLGALDKLKVYTFTYVGIYNRYKTKSQWIIYTYC